MTLLLSREDQLAYDFGIRNGTAGSRQQQRAAQRTAPSTPHTSVIQGPRNPFQPKLTTSFALHEKPSPSSKFLKASQDVRRIIYTFIAEDAKARFENGDAGDEILSDYAPLFASCQKIYNELHYVEFLPFLVPQNRIRDLTTIHLFKDGLNYDKATDDFSIRTKSLALQKFTTLVIETPHNALVEDLMKIWIAISCLPIKHLTIRFTGADDYSTSTSAAFSCGLRPERSSRRLPAAGQLFRYRAKFVNNLRKLKNLESLVISNANLPVTYNQVVNNKSKLKKLSIVPDARSSLTYDWHNAVQNCNSLKMQSFVQGSTIPLNIKSMPPLEDLEISSNAMLYSSNLVRHALPTLKKLTLLIPDPSHQAGDLQGENLNFIGQISRNIQRAAIYGRKLQILRICFEPAIVDTTELPICNNRLEVAALVNSLNTELKGIHSLKNFELHMDYKPQFEKDGFIFATNLGDSLERFYVNERTFVKRNTEIPFAQIPVTKEDFAFDPPTSEDAINKNTRAPTSISTHHNLVREVTLDNFGVSSFSTPRFTTTNDLVRHLYPTDSGNPTIFPPDPTPSTSNTLVTPNHWPPKYANPDPNLTPSAEERLPDPRTDRIPYTKHLAFLSYSFTDTANNALRIIEAVDDANANNAITQATDLPAVDADRFRLLRLNGRLLDRERNKHLFADGYRPRMVLDDGEDAVVADHRTLPARRYPVVVRGGCGEGHWMCNA